MKNIYISGIATVLSVTMVCFCTSAIATPLSENFGKGSMNWGSGEMSATGIGVPPDRYRDNPARAHAMAVRAAKIDALRNLLETMKGVRVQSQTLVKDMAVESDLVRTVMEATVRNASMVGKPHYMDDGSVEVVMAINYRRSVAKIVLEQYEHTSVKTVSSTTPQVTRESSDSEPVVTGLVIDAVGKGLSTALAPRILDKDGNVVYSGSMVAENKRAEIVAYDTSPGDASKLPRLGGNALTIKALKVLDKTDVVISNDDAAKIGKAPGMADTLRQARVAFAL